MGRIIRHKHKKNFTIIPNAIANDTRISIEAKGALIFMLSRPPNWTFRHNQLRKALRVGKDRFQRIIESLIAAGYLRRDSDQPRDEGNRFAPYDYVVCDIASTGSSPVGPCDGNPERTFGRRKSAGDNKNDSISTDYNNTPPNPLIEPAEVTTVGEVLTDFGRAARDYGCRFIYEGSKPFEAWQKFRGDDGMPMPPIDIVLEGGISRRGVWLPSLWPPGHPDRKADDE